jgi:hypothetical protein
MKEQIMVAEKQIEQFHNLHPVGQGEFWRPTEELKELLKPSDKKRFDYAQKVLKKLTNQYSHYSFDAERDISGAGEVEVVI